MKSLPTFAVQNKTKQNNEAMDTFSIQSVIDRYGLDEDTIAPVLFPDVKFPKAAFSRVLSGVTNLDTEQLERLAKYLGVMTSDLFTLNGWKPSVDDNLLLFTRGDYQVRVNFGGSFLTVFKDGKLIHEELKQTSGMTVQAFGEYINSIITVYENGGN